MGERFVVRWTPDATARASIALGGSVDIDVTELVAEAVEAERNRLHGLAEAVADCAALWSCDINRWGGKLPEVERLEEVLGLDGSEHDDVRADNIERACRAMLPEDHPHREVVRG